MKFDNLFTELTAEEKETYKLIHFQDRCRHYLLILEAIQYDLKKPLKKHKKEIIRNIDIASIKCLPFYNELRGLHQLPKCRR